MRPLLLVCALVVSAPAAALGQDPVSFGGAEIRFGGRLHVQYQQGSAPDAEPGHVFARRARLKADIRFGDYLEARLQPDFADGGALLEDAWVALRPWEGLRITMGQFNRTLEGFELASSNDLPIIERDGRVDGGLDCAGVGGACSLSRLLEKLDFVGRDLGMRVEWDLGQGLLFLGSLTNGTGTNVADENRAKSVSLRAEFTPLDPLTIAVFHGIHDHSEPGVEGPETRFARAYGADVVWGRLRDGARLQAAWAWGDNWRADADARFRGAHALGSWYLHLAGSGPFQGLEPMLRVGWSDGAVGVDGARGLLVTPGVAAYIQDRNRIALNLDVVDPARGPARWSLKVQTYAVF